MPSLMELTRAGSIATAAASARSAFALAEVKWNLVAAAGGVFRLPRVVGRPVAVDVMLTGTPLPAERAVTLRLVSRLAGVGADVRELARQVATEVAGNAPVAVRLTRKSVEIADTQAWGLCDELVDEVGESADTADE